MQKSGERGTPKLMSTVTKKSQTSCRLATFLEHIRKQMLLETNQLKSKDTAACRERWDLHTCSSGADAAWHRQDSLMNWWRLNRGWWEIAEPLRTKVSSFLFKLSATGSIMLSEKWPVRVSRKCPSQSRLRTVKQHHCRSSHLTPDLLPSLLWRGGGLWARINR